MFSIYLRTFNPLFTLQELIITDVYNSFFHETTQALELATGIQQCVTVFHLFYATLLNSVMENKKNSFHINNWTEEPRGNIYFLEEKKKKKKKIKT